MRKVYKEISNKLQAVRIYLLVIIFFRSICSLAFHSSQTEVNISVTCKNCYDITGNCYKASNIYAIESSDYSRTIGRGAFEGCNHLRIVTVAPMITDIRESAFANCENLLEVRIPASVTVCL